MSMQQLNTFLRNQDEYSRRFWEAPQPMFFQYDYAESQQAFKNKYPSSELRSLGGLSSWEWFIDGNSLPNIRLRFYNQNLHDPVAPVLAPATTIDQCKMRPPPGVLGFVYAMSHTDLAALEQEQSLKGRQQLYLPIELQTKSINGTLTTKIVLASVFMDMANTRDGYVDLTNQFTNLNWVTAIKRMLQTGMLMWYVKTVEMKLKGKEMSFEPFFISHKDNPVVDPRAARKQASISSFASLKQQKQQERQQEEQEKRKQSSKQPIITFSQQQKDAMLQQILRHGNIPMEQASKLTEKQKSLVVGKYLRKRQLMMHERQKIEQGRQERNPNPNVEVPVQQQNQHHIQISHQQSNSHTEAILNDVVRKQKMAVREEESRHSSSMPPPTHPARRSSQSGQGQGQAQNGNSKPSPTQLNYPQNPNNLKRPASNSISSANGAPDAKRQNMGVGNEVRRSASTPNTNANESAAPEPKRKYAGRGRPRKNPIVQVPAGNGAQNVNQDAGYGVGAGGKVRANANLRGDASSGDHMQNANGSGSGNGNDNGNLKGNNNMLDRTQVLPHVEQAAQMVHYFQPKMGVDRAGDGRLR
ncbi:hypothetical protein OCU04_004844 [Sclerotinia nivalis]|uniref:Uncharacterized protein n=1 Tax=Sclerotinia nivalis TaxID=352851 RepID=A0A9X0DME2_9HELO|nr:hypothetical protein OCU04_004844 [Sclerotinia nivalis]